MMSIFQNFTIFFPPPPSLFINAMSIISLTSLASGGLSEINGKNMQYSKFWNFNSQKSSTPNQIKLSSRQGMLFAYTPAFLSALASLFLVPHHSIRSLLFSSALTIHFFKRLFEVLSVHKYSSKMVLEASIQISLSYFLSTSTMIYAQQLSQAVPEPAHDLKFIGIALFLVGISGNFYHHYLLSVTRKEGEREYKIPSGGLFELLICPHYLFEIIEFFGLSLLAQTLYVFCFTMGSALYLSGRSYATRRWYVSKFEDFPQHVKALIPFIY